MDVPPPPLDFNPMRYPLAMSELRYISGESAWSGHIPFALALIEMARPRTFVELGTHWGDSYLAFCQAVAQLALGTRCAAVDTWLGDAHTRPYSDAVFQRVRNFHDPAYGAFSKLMRMTFDEAVKQFPDNSIDLLHIDGLHTYEAVRHDFETWLPKLSEQGVVLFHDTAAKYPGFGVWQLWAELENKYPSFQFLHESGLGVLAVGKEPPAAVMEFLDVARRNEEQVRGYFTALGGRWMMLSILMRTAAPLRAARKIVNDWRGRTGRPVQQVNDHPQPLAYGTYTDIQELLGQFQPK